jgi:RNA-directed DNA polymerase
MVGSQIATGAPLTFLFSKGTFYKLDRILWRNILNGPAKDITTLDTRKLLRSCSRVLENWQFFGKFNNGKTILLRMFGYFHIKRHKLICGKANPFDPYWDAYFAT